MVHTRSHRRGRILTLQQSRIAPTPIGQRRCGILGREDLYIPVGYALVHAEAVRLSGYHDIGSGAWNWISLDGLVLATNETAFSGGNLEDSGNGIGTVIEKVVESNPFPTTIYVKDEEL